MHENRIDVIDVVNREISSDYVNHIWWKWTTEQEEKIDLILNHLHHNENQRSFMLTWFVLNKYANVHNELLWERKMDE